MGKNNIVISMQCTIHGTMHDPEFWRYEFEKVIKKHAKLAQDDIDSVRVVAHIVP